MCADSMVSTGDTWWPCNKITEINDCLVGCAGEADQGKKFLKWFADQSQSKPKLTDAFCALVLTRTELHYYCSTLIPETIERGFHAVGTGGPIALGAMLAGKDLTRGFIDQHLSPSAVTVVNTHLPESDPSFITVWWNPEEEADYLRFLRSRS